MIHPVAQTSLEAYKEIIPQIGQKQFEVYQALKSLNTATNAMIARHLNWPINCVTPRISELRNDEKLVGYSHTNVCPITKHKAQFWKIVK